MSEEPPTDQGARTGPEDKGAPAESTENVGQETAGASQDETPNQAAATTADSDPQTDIAAIKAATAGDTTSATGKHPEPSPNNTETPEAKRPKREWLAFHGARHTRVGADFQVASLPQVESAKENAGDAETN